MAITNSGEDAITKGSDEEHIIIDSSAFALDDFYDVDGTVRFLTSLSPQPTKVALQFPDSLLRDAAGVDVLLRSRLPDVQFFVLADTQYGSCCVDDVASQHIAAEAIVHYGPTCLSNTARVPVYWVYGKLPIDTGVLVERLSEHLQPDARVLVLFDVMYNYAREVGTPEPPQPGDHGRTYELDPDTTIADYTLLFIGGPCNTLTNICVMHHTCTVYAYTPADQSLQIVSSTSNRAVMRRYVMMQKARDADVFGIIMGTLGVANYLSAYEGVKRTLRKAGRKYYTFVLGKLNAAKLVNFMEINVYVLIACPESTLIDSKEFYQPVVTPYELEVALCKDKDWMGEYVLDFHKLSLSNPTVPAADDDAGRTASDAGSSDDEDADAPHFSLVTGTYKSHVSTQSNRAINRLINNTTDLVTTGGSSAALAVLSSPGARFLNERSWKGLDAQAPVDSVEIEEGRHGIASGYAGEVGYEEKRRKNEQL
ncbi:Diphthamide biosynthesis protein 2 [Sorochytrium milnesiophthora]